jgi:TPR repeat protein
MNLEEIKTLAEAGNAEAQASLAQRGVICHDIASAWKWANLSAAQNCPFGLYMLGLCYVNGYNTDQDLDKAQ